MIAILRLALELLLGVSLMAAATPPAQSNSMPMAASSPLQRPGQLGPPEDPAVTTMERRREREANKQRQQELQRDADRLLQLATELKLYVDKSNENVLSLNVIKKAEQIEKLAKSVKTKMRAY